MNLGRKQTFPEIQSRKGSTRIQVEKRELETTVYRKKSSEVIDDQIDTILSKLLIENFDGCSSNRCFEKETEILGSLFKRDKKLSYVPNTIEPLNRQIIHGIYQEDSNCKQTNILRNDFEFLLGKDKYEAHRRVEGTEQLYHNRRSLAQLFEELREHSDVSRNFSQQFYFFEELSSHVATLEMKPVSGSGIKQSVDVATSAKKILVQEETGQLPNHTLKISPNIKSNPKSIIGQSNETTIRPKLCRHSQQKIEYQQPMLPPESSLPRKTEHMFKKRASLTQNQFIYSVDNSLPLAQFGLKDDTQVLHNHTNLPTQISQNANLFGIDHSSEIKKSVPSRSNLSNTNKQHQMPQEQTHDLKSIKKNRSKSTRGFLKSQPSKPQRFSSTDIQYKNLMVRTSFMPDSSKKISDGPITDRLIGRETVKQNLKLSQQNILHSRPKFKNPQGQQNRNLTDQITLNPKIFHALKGNLRGKFNPRGTIHSDQIRSQSIQKAYKTFEPRVIQSFRQPFESANFLTTQQVVASIDKLAQDNRSNIKNLNRLTKSVKNKSTADLHDPSITQPKQLSKQVDGESLYQQLRSKISIDSRKGTDRLKGKSNPLVLHLDKKISSLFATQQVESVDFSHIKKLKSNLLSGKSHQKMPAGKIKKNAFQCSNNQLDDIKKDPSEAVLRSNLPVREVKKTPKMDPPSSKIISHQKTPSVNFKRVDGQSIVQTYDGLDRFASPRNYYALGSSPLTKGLGITSKLTGTMVKKLDSHRSSKQRIAKTGENDCKSNFRFSRDIEPNFIKTPSLNITTKFVNHSKLTDTKIGKFLAQESKKSMIANAQGSPDCRKQSKRGSIGTTLLVHRLSLRHF